MSYVNKINKNSADYDLQDARIQDDLSTATEGQLLGINAQKKIVPVNAPETGVTSFNGRSGAVSPANGDYTAAMVGADVSGAAATAKTEAIADAATKYIPLGEKGANSGVATLGSDGKVPSTQLPSLNYIPTSAKGANGGVAELDSDGKVPSSQLPSYVDDVLEFVNKSAFPATGESGKIYIALDTNKTYRWGGSEYVEISQSLALGETSSTAYRGDKGKVAYDHASAKGSQFASGMYKITTNAEGHVTAATAVVKSDITALDIPGSDTNQTVKGNGTAFGASDAIDIVGNGSVSVTADTTNKKITITGTDTNTDTKVTQSLSTADGDYPVILKNSTTATDSPTSTTNYAAAVKVNPSTGNLTVTKINGVTVGSSPKFTDTTIAVQATQPSDTKVLWIDTSSGGVAKYYNGTAWVAVKAVFS